MPAIDRHRNSNNIGTPGPGSNVECLVPGAGVERGRPSPVPLAVQNTSYY